MVEELLKVTVKELDCSVTGEVAEALYFDSGGQRLFGWLHRPPAGVIANVGLVVCKPFGYEAICSYRSMRAFAEAAAALGVPTLRFDYLGTGDAAEIDPRADQLQVWSRDVVAAVAELQRQTGVERVCLLGFRFGALLATLAASQCKAVTALALVSPIISGRRYLRELRTTRLAASLGSDPSESPGGGVKDGAAVSDDSMEVSGFFYSAATLAALTEVDLKTRGAPPVAEILVIDGSSFPVARAWATQLTEAGVPTQYLALPGLVEMIMTAPQFASIPEQMIAATRDWLSRMLSACAISDGNGAASRPRPAPHASIQAMRLPDKGSLQTASVTERPVFFGSEAVLFGIVTEPRQGELRRRAVILLNAGADYHIGASRIYVGLARHWAARGYVVLRMDFAGLGDSGTRPGRPGNEVFPPEAVDDIRGAIEWMRAHYKVRDITLCGICSGGYHALRAAAAAVQVNRIFLVNPKNYFWKEGMTITDMQVGELVSNPRAYREQVLSLAAWSRLLTGRINVGYVVKIYLGRLLLAMESFARECARRLRIRLPHDLGWELEEIAARGVRIVFVFARTEPGLDLLTIQGGSSVKRIGDRCRVHIIDNADHVFSKPGPRVILEKILSDELFTRTEWAMQREVGTECV
jgi:dienelactone hydrolase